MNAVVLKGADHFQTGAVADMREPWIFVTAEVALKNARVFRAIEDSAPGFQFADAIRRFPGVELRHSPIIDVLAAAHRVGEVDLPAIAVVHVRQSGRDAAFGHYRVRFAEQTLADHADGNAGP